MTKFPRLVRTLLPALTLAILAVLLFTTWNVDRFRPRLERAFAAATGHALTLHGPVELRVLPAPELLARDVSIANLPGGSRPAMITADAVRLSIDPFSLLDHRLDITSAALEHADILLETVRGIPNWRLQPRPAPNTAAATIHAPSRPMSVSLDEFEATSSRMRWNAPGRLGSGEIAIDRLHVRHDGVATTLFAAVRHGDAHLTLSAATTLQAGLRQAASSQARPLRAALELTAAGQTGHLTFDGSVTPSARSYAGRATAHLSQLTLLNHLFAHAALPSASMLDVEGDIEGQGHEMRVSSLAASGTNADVQRWTPGLSLARFAIKAKTADAPLSIDLSGTDHGVALSVTGTAGSLALVQRNGQGDAPLDATLSAGRDVLTLHGTLTRTASRAGAIHARVALDAPDPTPLARLAGPLARLSSTSGQLALTTADGALAAGYDAQELRLGGTPLPPSHLTMSLNAARDLDVSAAMAGHKPWLIASKKHDSPTLALDVHGQNIPAAFVEALLGGRGVDGTLSMAASLQGTLGGGGLDARTLSGPIDATLTNAVIASSLARGLIAPFVAGAHLPLLPGSPFRLACATETGSIAAGRLTMASFTVVSPIIDAQGHGTVDLATSMLALAVTPTLHLGPTSVSTAASVTGPFAHPQVALAAGVSGRFGLRIGGGPPSLPGPCGTAARTKPPNAAAFLRGLGFLR